MKCKETAGRERVGLLRIIVEESKYTFFFTLKGENSSVFILQP